MENTEQELAIITDRHAYFRRLFHFLRTLPGGDWSDLVPGDPRTDWLTEVGYLQLEALRIGTSLDGYKGRSDSLLGWASYRVLDWILDPRRTDDFREQAVIAYAHFLYADESHRIGTLLTPVESTLPTFKYIKFRQLVSTALVFLVDEELYTNVGAGGAYHKITTEPFLRDCFVKHIQPAITEEV